LIFAGNTVIKTQEENMGGFIDILGTMVQQGMSKSSGTRMSNTFGAGRSGGGLEDVLGSLAGMLNTPHPGPAPRSVPASPSAQAPHGSGGGLGGVLGDVLGNLGSNKAVLGGLGALAGALLGGGGKSHGRGAVGGGGLAVLASLAISALQKAGQAPTRAPRALLEPQTPDDVQALEQDAEIIVRAMINAAKADGRIDDVEIKKIIGNLEQGGLTAEEKDFFVAEANKPMDINSVIASAAGQPDMAAQIYAASLLAIEVDTPAEQQYMQQLAAGLGLDPQVTGHIEDALGVRIS
jgi:uncharacterized membrane protein YebE (DUF533 family)